MTRPDLSPSAVLAAYAAALALVFVAALAVGGAVGPVGTAADDQHSSTQHSEKQR